MKRTKHRRSRSFSSPLAKEEENDEEEDTTFDSAQSPSQLKKGHRRSASLKGLLGNSEDDKQRKEEKKKQKQEREDEKKKEKEDKMKWKSERKLWESQDGGGDDKGGFLSRLPTLRKNKKTKERESKISPTA